jgi:hypothetical protein
MVTSRLIALNNTQTFLVIVKHRRGQYSLRRAVAYADQVWSIYWVSERTGSLADIRNLCGKNDYVLSGFYREPTGVHKANLLERID